MKAGEIVDLDNLVEACGFFVGNTETFGGYGCSHPAQESRDPDTGEGQCDHCNAITARLPGVSAQLSVAKWIAEQIWTRG